MKTTKQHTIVMYLNVDIATVQGSVASFLGLHEAWYIQDSVLVMTR